jgi:hypothetical protein
MSEHTKGKWEVKFGATKNLGVRSKGYFICFLTEPNKFTDQPERYKTEVNEMHADALLISKAPEMYDLLKRIVEYSSDKFIDDEMESIEKEGRALLESINPEQ